MSVRGKTSQLPAPPVRHAYVTNKDYYDDVYSVLSLWGLKKTYYSYSTGKKFEKKNIPATILLELRSEEQYFDDKLSSIGEGGSVNSANTSPKDSRYGSSSRALLTTVLKRLHDIESPPSEESIEDFFLEYAGEETHVEVCKKRYSVLIGRKEQCRALEKEYQQRFGSHCVIVSYIAVLSSYLLYDFDSRRFYLLTKDTWTRSKPNDT